MVEEENDYFHWFARRRFYAFAAACPLPDAAPRHTALLPHLFESINLSLILSGDAWVANDPRSFFDAMVAKRVVGQDFDGRQACISSRSSSRRLCFSENSTEAHERTTGEVRRECFPSERLKTKSNFIRLVYLRVDSHSVARTPRSHPMSPFFPSTTPKIISSTPHASARLPSAIPQPFLTVNVAQDTTRFCTFLHACRRRCPRSTSSTRWSSTVDRWTRTS